MAFSPSKLGLKRVRNDGENGGTPSTPTRQRTTPPAQLSPTIRAKEKRDYARGLKKARHDDDSNDGSGEESDISTPRANRPKTQKDAFNDSAPIHAEALESMMELELRKLLGLIRDTSVHREWPEKIRQLATALAFRIVPEAFMEPEADSVSNVPQNDDLKRLATSIEKIAHEVSVLQGRLDGVTPRGTGNKSAANTASTSDAKSSHAKGPVIKPAPKNTQTTPKVNPPTPKNPLAAYHPSRLIVTIRDGPLGAGNRLSEREAVNAINERLAAADDSKHLRVVAVRYNEKSNCVVFTREDQTAAELQQHEAKFLSVLAGPGATAKTLLDKPWYKVQINGVDTGSSEGRIHTSEEIWDELRLNNPVFESVALLHAPRWMRPEGDLSDQRASSVVLAFKSEEDALSVLHKGVLIAFGRFCRTAKHDDRPPLQQCSRCWQLGHFANRCQAETRCRLCGEGHPEVDHPWNVQDGEDIDMGRKSTRMAELRCAICEGKHAANSRDCPMRRRAIGSTREGETTAKATKRAKAKGKGKERAQDGGWTEVTARGGGRANPPSRTKRTADAGGPTAGPSSSAGASGRLPPSTSGNSFQGLQIEEGEIEEEGAGAPAARGDETSERMKLDKLKASHAGLTEEEAREVLKEKGGNIVAALQLLQERSHQAAQQRVDRTDKAVRPLNEN